MKAAHPGERKPSGGHTVPLTVSDGVVAASAGGETALFATGFAVLALGLGLSIWEIRQRPVAAATVVLLLAVAAALLCLATTRLARARRDRRAVEGVAESVIATAPDGIVTVDERGTVLSANPAIERILGWREEELVGRNVNVLMPSSDRERHGGYLAHHLETGKGPVIESGREVRGLRRDGTVVLLRLNVGKRLTAGGVRFTGVLTDLSERERAEDALGESNARLREVLDAATEVAIIATDRIGTITDFNRGAERMLGFRATDLVGCGSPLAFHLSTEVDARGRELSRDGGREVSGFDVLVERAREGGHEEREWTYVRKDGSRLTVLLSVTAMRNLRGALTGFLGIARDVTEQRRVEMLKSAFISTVSHELRTPLTSIRGALGLLAGGATGELPESARELVRIAHRNSEGLVRIINDILDMEKIESGQLAFAFSGVHLPALLGNALEANQPIALEARTRIELRPGCPSVRLRVDVDRILQVLANLLANAARFSPPEKPVELSAALAGKFVRVTVRDHGPGIPSEFRARVFQRFAQADSSDRRLRGGTGLGLAISKEIVSRHGGQLGYETAPGWGTAFHVDLPRILETGAIPIVRSPSPGRRALVCEDDTDVVNLLTLLLEREGLEVDVAATGARARVFLSERIYATLVLDVGLSDGEGPALLDWLRERPRTAGLPVVVLSTRGIDDRDGLEGGAIELVDWIAGPVENSRLAAALHRGLPKPPDRRPRVLLAGADPESLSRLRNAVPEFVDLAEERTVAGAGARLHAERYDLVVLDAALPDGPGLDALRASGFASPPPSPVVLLEPAAGHGRASGDAFASLSTWRTTGARLLATLRSALARATDEPLPAIKESP